MAENRLKYTGITYDDILQQINDLIASDGKYDRFRSSSIAQTLIEIFAGTTNLTTHYIGRRADECYFDTAQLRSSVVSLARMFGYVVNRKEPARAYLKVIIKGDVGVVGSNGLISLQIPAYSKFSYGGESFILLNTFNIEIDPAKYNPNAGIEYTIDTFKMPMEIIQGDVLEVVFAGNTNTQVGAPFQLYRIDDPSFSNVYGDKDIFHDGITRVYVGETKSEATRYTIDRRSLINWDNINDTIYSGPLNVCVIKTTPNNGVDILFGDDNYASLGAKTRNDNIYVEYLSTSGKVSNKVGVIGERVTFNGSIYNMNGVDITSNIYFELNSDIFGGQNDETKESIKYSAPKIYYSLDRLVSKQDYVAYLKSLTTPIDVRNAYAWGENEECDEANAFALRKMFNVALFTVAGSLYNFESSIYMAKSGTGYNDVVLDINYNPNKLQTQGYFNIFILQEMVRQLKMYSVITSFKEITSNNTPDSEIDEYVAFIKREILEKYQAGVEIGFKYGTMIHDNASHILADDSVYISSSELTSFGSLTGTYYLQAMASLLNSKFEEFSDMRANQHDNDNFQGNAFVGRKGEDLVQYKYSSDDDVNIFRFRFNELDDEIENLIISPCYIETIYANTFTDLLKLGNANVHQVSETYDKYEMNGKITNLVNDLNKRSQVNVKNVYTSPIIHRIRLIGDIYIKPLYDIPSVKKDIINSLYTWLDINADFNKSIYLSNVIEIIESHSAVIHADVRFGVEYDDDNIYGTDDTKNIYVQYGDDADGVGYMNDLEAYMSSQYYAYIKPIGRSHNHITERSFYDFVGKLYFALNEQSDVNCGSVEYTCNGKPNYGKFIGKVSNTSVSTADKDIIRTTIINTDFAKIVEQMYHDVKPYITGNIIDTKGNINNEYSKNGAKIKGFTLGSEIAQVVLEKTEYSTTDMLNFKYK